VPTGVDELARDTALRISSSERPARRRGFGIGLNADGEFLRAVDQDLRNARNLRQRLPDGDVAIFVDGRKRQRLEFIVTNRMGTRPDSLCGNSAESIISTGRRRCATVKRGLNVQRGAVDVAVEVELDGDRGGALRGTRRHRGNARNGRELTLDRPATDAAIVSALAPGSVAVTRSSGNQPWEARRPAAGGSRKRRTR
jgi:hypothetical protein